MQSTIETVNHFQFMVHLDDRGHIFLIKTLKAPKPVRKLTVLPKKARVHWMVLSKFSNNFQFISYY